MGYRNYLGTLPKADYETIKDMTLEEFYKHKGYTYHEDPDELEDWVSHRDVVKTELVELGKDVDSFDKKFFTPFFSDAKLNKQFDNSDTQFVKVEKEFLAELIEYYAKKVRSYYQKILEPFKNPSGEYKPDFLNELVLNDSSKAGVLGLFRHVQDMAGEWGIGGYLGEEQRPYSLDPEREMISSWKFEHSIFQMVSIYRNFDFENNVLIYYGH
jgi:hypothetical protein